MKIKLLSDERIRLEGMAGPMTIEAESADASYSPFHMMGSALATCTFSVLYSWATHAGLGVDDLAIEVGWSFAEDPHRVGSYDIVLDWPSLPDKRRSSAVRAAGLCTVKKTLEVPPAIHVELAGAAAA